MTDPYEEIIRSNQRMLKAIVIMAVIVAVMNGAVMVVRIMTCCDHRAPQAEKQDTP